MAAWTDPLPSTVWKDEVDLPKLFTSPNWHSSAGDAVLHGTPNGSMEKETLSIVTE